MADYIYGGTRRHPSPSMATPLPKKISTPAGQRLSVILENGAAPSSSSNAHPAFRSASRSFSRLYGVYGTGGQKHDRPKHDYQRPVYEKPPPAYSIWSDTDTSGRKSDRFNALKNNIHIARRGGWRRLGLILLVLVAIIVALAVGLAVGLRISRDSRESATPSSSSQGSPTSPATPSSSSTSAQFPLGTYSIAVFLDTVSTNCTANPSTWLCYPYTTYTSNPTAAMAIFDWIVAPGAQLSTYQISSTDNPLSILFASTPLQLIDPGQASERYTFQFAMDKQVIPNAPLTPDGASTICFYNATTFQASLYTKMARTYPSSTPSPTPDAYPDWPYAVRVEQVAGGGTAVPNCYKTVDGSVTGEPITQGLAPQAAGSLCSCLYRNWITPL